MVKTVTGPMAVVSVPRKSACEGCTAGACRPESQGMEIEAVNRAGAQPGQRVRVSMQPYAYMKGSMLVYGVPALALILGAVAGKEFMSPLFPESDPDLLSAIFGFGACMISFAAVKFWTVMSGKRTKSKPVVEEILGDGPVP